MESTDRPDAEAPLNLVGHVLVAFANPADMRGAMAALRDDGFTDDEVVAYSPEQMQRQAQFDIEHSSLLASIGQDLNLMKANLLLAQQGHSFLVVRAWKDERVARVVAASKLFHAVRARQYGMLLVEELIDERSGANQVFESTDRGLDEQAIPARATGSQVFFANPPSRPT